MSRDNSSIAARYKRLVAVDPCGENSEELGVFFVDLANRTVDVCLKAWESAEHGTPDAEEEIFDFLRISRVDLAPEIIERIQRRLDECLFERSDTVRKELGLPPDNHESDVPLNDRLRSWLRTFRQWIRRRQRKCFESATTGFLDFVQRDSTTREAVWEHLKRHREQLELVYAPGNPKPENIRFLVDHEKIDSFAFDALKVFLEHRPGPDHREVDRSATVLQELSATSLRHLGYDLTPFVESVSDHPDIRLVCLIYASFGDGQSRLERMLDQVAQCSVDRDAIEAAIFGFEDVLNQGDRAIQKIIRETLEPDLAMALKGLPAPSREKIYRNMSDSDVGRVEEQIEWLGPIRLHSVEDARQRILRTAFQLERNGEIEFFPKSDPLVS